MLSQRNNDKIKRSKYGFKQVLHIDGNISFKEDEFSKHQAQNLKFILNKVSN